MASIDDTGRSVMEQMMALFTPPGRETKGSKLKKFELHPYYKRPGKGHNHDCCDACGEGGDLICCDNCPASFHFSCHAPPLEEEDIPMGDWTCLRCYHREQLRLATIGAQMNLDIVGCTLPKEGEVGPTSGGSSAGSETGETRPFKSRYTKIATKKQLEAALKAEKEKKVKVYRQKYDVYLKVKPVTNSCLDVLIAAAQVTNAEQFKLPHELECREPLPFSWKWAEERQDDFDTYPKNCFSCRKTSRGVPSIACDYCSSIYHLDCLDPPLCEIPRERWMCPVHVEQFLDSNLVSTTNLSQRLKIWQKYARSPVDPDTVRLEFFRRVRAGKLYRAGRVKKTVKPVAMRIKVPGFVQAHYKERVQGIPVEDEELYRFSGKGIRDPKNLDNDQKNWLETVLFMQTKSQDTEKSKSKSREKIKRAWRKRKGSKMTKKIKSRDSLTNGSIGSSGQLSDAEMSDSDSLSTASECSLDLEDSQEILTRSTRDELREYLALHHKSGDVEILDPVVLKFLAAQKINDLFPKPIQVNTENEVRARATLVPLHQSSKAQPFLMRYRTLDIGLGGKMNLDLASYGKCDFVSKCHAKIFFDQFSRVFEIINYSEHGTIVDNIIYTVDQRDFPVKNNGSYRMSASPEGPNCQCSTSFAKLKDSNNSCEVSAILKHGSYLRFGCLQFVFCITNHQVDADSNQKEMEKSEKDEDTKENIDMEIKENIDIEIKENRDSEKKENRDSEKKENRDSEEVNENRDTERKENTDEEIKSEANEETEEDKMETANKTSFAFYDDEIEKSSDEYEKGIEIGVVDED